MSELDKFYAFRIKALWQNFWKESFAFWMICGYLFFEYFRPQSIYPAIDILPWTSIFLGFAAIGIVFDKQKRWVSDPANKWLIVFLLVILLSSFLAYWPATSYVNLEFFYTWVIIYFLIINIVNTPRRFYIFFLIFCLASFKLSLHGAQVWATRGFGFSSWGITGPPGFFRNSGELSIQMLCFFPVGYYLYTALKDRVRKWEKFVLALFFITPAMTILGASSRGAQLALLVQVCIMFYKQIFRVKVLVGLGLFVFLAVTFLPEEQKERFQTMGDDRTSEQRILYWKNGIEMIKEHPVLGVGYFNFIPYYNQHYSHDLLVKQAELPHNIFIQVATDTGLVGLLVYLILISRFFKPTKISHSPDSAFEAAALKGIRIGMIGFIIAGQFVTVGYYPFMWIALALIVALNNSFRSTVKEGGFREL